MCGIAACFSSTGSISPEMLGRATASLRHRGPDSQGQWIEPDGTAGLAHARLSLLDLSPKGNQPILSGDGRQVLVHNGEFYDFERERKSLEARGHHFHTATDSEILLPLYRDLGTAALHRLRGEFAFVHWDRDNRQVFAARDRFGIKPLFYCNHQGRLYFASEIKALFSMGVPARWDREVIFQFHTTWTLPPHRTLYDGVFQIPPGHFLLASAGARFTEPRLESYWDFDYPVEGTTAADLPIEEEIARLREKFLEAVKLRLRADVPVACYLSGGLDSCSVLGAAAQQSSQPIHAFTLSFVDDAAYDEAPIAREMAAQCGAVYHEIPIRWNDLKDGFADALWTSEIPFVNTHGVAKFLLSRAVRKAGFKAVLTGEGSDEIFAGYAHFRKDAIVAGGGDEVEAQLKRLADTNAASRPLMLATELSPRLRGLEKTLGFIPSFMSAQAQGAERVLDLLRDELSDDFAQHDSWRQLLNEVDVPRQLWGRAPVHQSLYLWSRTMLPNYLLTNLGDRMEMAHSIEGRLPFLDHVLVEHVVRLPLKLKIGQDLTEKYLLREAARPFLTDTVYRRQKHPFLAPPAAASPSSPLFHFLQDTLRSRRFANSPIYNADKVQRLLESVPQMDRERQGLLDGMLTAMLSFAVLEERLGITA